MPRVRLRPAAQDLGDLPRPVRDTATTWSQVLGRARGERPAPDVWSPLEYGCHVRDVHVLFAQRLRAMLDEDEPTFANWDQDATALESDYASQDASDGRGRAGRGGQHRRRHLRDRHRATKDRPGGARTATASPSRRSAANAWTTSSTTFDDVGAQG